VSRCDEFIARLEDRRLQEGGPWPQDLLLHASRCPRCAEILAIFQAIPTQVKHLPRGARVPGEVPATVVLSVHDGIPASPNPFRRLWIALGGLAAGLALALVPAQLDPSPGAGMPAGSWPQLRPTAGAQAALRPLAEASTWTPATRSAMPASPAVVVAAAPPSLPPVPLPALAPPAPAPDAVADDAPVRLASTSADVAPEPIAASSPRRRSVRRGPSGPDHPRVRVGQGLVLLSDEWGSGAAYGGEIGVQNRIWFDRHVGLTLDTGVRYGVAPGFDALPDARERSATAGHVAGTGSVMLSLRARPATLGMGVGISAGEWDPGPGACDGLARDVPERATACDDWGYVTPDLVAALDFDLSESLSLGVRWTGHEQALELGRGGEVDTGAGWVNRVTVDATFRPGAGPGIALAQADHDPDGAPAAAHGIVSR